MNQIAEKPFFVGESAYILKFPECRIELQKKNSRVIVLTVEGVAPKQCSEPLFEKLQLLCHARSNLKLFIDLGKARQIPAPVTHWTRFLKEHRHAFDGVYLLAQSRENYLAASILRHLSGTEDRFKVIKAKTIFNAFLQLSA